MKRAALLLALGAAACSPARQSASNKNVTAAKAETSSRYTLRSTVEDTGTAQLAALPATTALPVDAGAACAHFVQPASDAGRRAAQKGWRVLAETPFHQLQAVLIARGAPMTSGRCSYIDTNIAFFEGGRLIGILYPKGKDLTPFAAIEVVNDHLRVWSTDPMVIGQVDLAGTALRFGKVSGSDAVCDGKYRVPAVFTRHYSKGRVALLAANWVAKPAKTEFDVYDPERDLRSRFPEVEDCASTGYGECRFTFTAKQGPAVLHITTIGYTEDPFISSYAVSCDGDSR